MPELTNEQVIEQLIASSREAATLVDKRLASQVVSLKQKNTYQVRLIDSLRDQNSVLLDRIRELEKGND